MTSVDVVATSASDPRGLVLGAAPLPLTIVGVIMAAAIMPVARSRAAWRQLVPLAVVSAVAGLGAYLIVQDFLGALPGEHAATWASLSLTRLRDQRIVMLGAGSAAIGVADMLRRQMAAAGVPGDQARRRFFIVDINGLLTEDRSDLSAEQRTYAPPERSPAGPGPAAARPAWPRSSPARLRPS